jgi:hypothetical protein
MPRSRLAWLTAPRRRSGLRSFPRRCPSTPAVQAQLSPQPLQLRVLLLQLLQPPCLVHPQTAILFTPPEVGLLHHARVHACLRRRLFPFATATSCSGTPVCPPQFSWMIPDEMALYGTTFDLHFECVVPAVLEYDCHAPALDGSDIRRFPSLEITHRFSTQHWRSGAIQNSYTISIWQYSLKTIPQVVLDKCVVL